MRHVKIQQDLELAQSIGLSNMTSPEISHIEDIFTENKSYFDNGSQNESGLTSESEGLVSNIMKSDGEITQMLSSGEVTPSLFLKKIGNPI